VPVGEGQNLTRMSEPVALVVGAVISDITIPKPR
jgi:hypothetical protein